jgi:hypothetical protein
LIQQTEVLNKVFSAGFCIDKRIKKNKSKNVCNKHKTPFRFIFDSVSYIHNNDWHMLGNLIDREKVLKKIHHKDPGKSINFYIIDSSVSLGSAWLPWFYAENSYMHGIFLSYRVIKNSKFQKYNRGYLVPHEVGHWLGLYHPYEYNCIGAEYNSDKVEDTPRIKKPDSVGLNSLKCPRDNKYRCKGSKNPKISTRNIMTGFIPDRCKRPWFTPGQINRMLEICKKYKKNFC